MPDWQPPWDDVAFDHGAAVLAAAACRRRAADVVAAVATLHTVAAADLDHWTGRHADHHTGRIAVQVARLHRHHGELLALARRIEAGADAATAEQRRREGLRADWHDQARRELAAGTRPVALR